MLKINARKMALVGRAEVEQLCSSTLLRGNGCGGMASLIPNGEFLAPPNDPFAGYEAYSQRNWDGYDADPVTPETVNAAAKLLNSMPPDWLAPEIAPGADGGIGFEWWVKNIKLFLDIGPGPFWSAYWRWSGGRGHIERRSVMPWSVADLLEHLPGAVTSEFQVGEEPNPVPGSPS